MSARSGLRLLYDGPVGEFSCGVLVASFVAVMVAIGKATVGAAE